MSAKYAPPFKINTKIVDLVAKIVELTSSLQINAKMDTNPKLRRENRIKTIQSSLAIENNSLSLAQVESIIDGKKVLGSVNEILEVKNAYAVYDQLFTFNPYSSDDLKKAHAVLMENLISEAGEFRSGGVGVFAGGLVLHMAPPPTIVPELIDNLMKWIKTTDTHPLIKSCVFHYEFEFIHPFADGNGRMGRLWQTRILSDWKAIFAWLPIETIIKSRQHEYYQAIRTSTQKSSSEPFIEYILQSIYDSLLAFAKTPEDNVANERLVLLLSRLKDNEELSAQELMKRVGLKSLRSFRANYLMPALKLKKIEMTIPDKPNSRNQKYKRVKQNESSNSN